MAATPESAEEWDEVRRGFSESIMIDTQITSLAQNLDGPDWPIKGEEETPANYIDLTRSEALELLALKGLSPDKLDLLVVILRETLAFDSPFGDMVEQNTVASARDNVLLRNMAKLGISENFPISLTALATDTREFCRLEQITTLGVFAVFAQSMAQNVIVGGDFRKLLNALSHVDDAALAELLPLRRGAQGGLHLVEALAQATRSADPGAHAKEAQSWFADEYAMLMREATSPSLLARHFVILGNPDLERKACALLSSPTQQTAPAAGIKRGFFGSLARLFKK